MVYLGAEHIAHVGFVQVDTAFAWERPKRTLGADLRHVLVAATRCGSSLTHVPRNAENALLVGAGPSPSSARRGWKDL